MKKILNLKFKIFNKFEMGKFEFFLPILLIQI